MTVTAQNILGTSESHSGTRSACQLANAGTTHVGVQSDCNIYASFLYALIA